MHPANVSNAGAHLFSEECIKLEPCLYKRCDLSAFSLNVKAIHVSHFSFREIAEHTSSNHSYSKIALMHSRLVLSLNFSGGMYHVADRCFEAQGRRSRSR